MAGLWPQSHCSHRSNWPRAAAPEPEASATVRVIDIRDPKSFAENHIPGAVRRPYGQWRGPATRPRRVPTTPSWLRCCSQGLGLKADSHAVVVSNRQRRHRLGAMARVYWTLEIARAEGAVHRQRRYASVDAAKLPLSTQPVKVAPQQLRAYVRCHMAVHPPRCAAKPQAEQCRCWWIHADAFYQGKTQAPAAKLAGTLPAQCSWTLTSGLSPKPPSLSTPPRPSKLPPKFRYPKGKAPSRFATPAIGPRQTGLA